MEYIFQDEQKIKVYANIQKHLFKLKQDPTEANIDFFFKDILPFSFLDQKEDLIMICQLFSILSRYHWDSSRLVVQLFERIMTPIKNHLQNQSAFFWTIFGGLNYYKLWMYEEGLIDIEQIILGSQSDMTSITAQYFLPEIIETNPELFHKEIKTKFPIFSENEELYSKESIENLKTLRKKFFTWLKNSLDFNDPFYREIEKDPLRLAIKMDDVSAFQAIISNLNISVNSIIDESIIEHFLRIDYKLHLIEFAVRYGSIKIFKFLFLKGAKLSGFVANYTILWSNYDLIHLVENSMKKEFDKFSLLYAILSWDQKIVKYIISNYHYDYLKVKEITEKDKNDEIDDKKSNSNDGSDSSNKEELNSKSDIGGKSNLKNSDDKGNENAHLKDNDNENSNSKNDNKRSNSKYDDDDEENVYSDYSNYEDDDYVIDQRIKTLDLLNDSETVLSDIIENTFFNLNFRFLRTYLLPFLRNNPSFVKKNIYEIINKTFYDHSTYLTSEFMKYPQLKLDYVNPSNSQALFAQLIQFNNPNVVEMLTKNPRIYLNKSTSFDGLCMAIFSFSSIKIIDLILNIPALKDLFTNIEEIGSIILTAMVNGNSYALEFFLSRNPVLDINDFNSIASQCISENHNLCLKIFIKYFKDKLEDSEYKFMISEFKSYLPNYAMHHLVNFSFEQLNKILNELDTK